MRRLSALTITLTMLLTGLVTAAGDSCLGGGWSATCNAENTGTSVDLTANATSPGRAGNAGNAGSGGNGGNGGNGDGIQPPSGGGGDATTPECTDALGRCDILYEVELLREVTLNDLASFAPDAPPLTGQPAGVAIVGMPANFVVDAGTQTVTGELFDLPVSVRFTPVSYLFVHGDGTAREAPTGGAKWEALGQAQFSATATSHAYGSRGTFTSHAAVRYSAAVDFGEGWAPVPGILELSTGGYAVDVLEVRTALVERTCVEDPGGPGC